MTTGTHHPRVFICLAGYFKGNQFIRECHRSGARVVLVTRASKVDEAWARDCLDDIIVVPDQAETKDYLCAVSEFGRWQKPDRIVALEESDVMTAARLREFFCLPGMNSVTAANFRDKLAMRHKARRAGLLQADFVHMVNYQEVGEFMERFPPPWVVKPRADASAIGIKTMTTEAEVWRLKDSLDIRPSPEERSAYYLLESFIPGDVYHVNSLVNLGKIVFASVNRYGRSPLDVTQQGGVSTSYSVQYDSPEHQQLLKANNLLLKNFEISHGTTHAEFIRSSLDGCIYFLEIAARVGGAYTIESVEAATGINLWREWARLEIADEKQPYQLPPLRREYSGLAVSLARQEFPDTDAYSDPEIVFRARKAHHVGLVLRSPEQQRILDLLGQYEQRFQRDFTAIAPQLERPN